ncbi:MAG: biopolymer transporter ExbD [Bacteroidota bacterium]
MARKVPEIPSASMADIAFMLLIFFLVATTMDMDRGLARKLPPIPPDDQVIDENNKVKERNVFVVLINKYDQLLVENAYMDVKILREKTKEFIANPANKDNLPEKEALSELKAKAIEAGNSKEANNIQRAIDLLGNVSVSKGVVSLQNDRGTSYKKYIEVQNELVAAYNELRDEMCKSRFGNIFDDCTEEQQDAVQLVLPQRISEAEPKHIK